MAQKILVTMTDDLDGSEGAETVVFGLDGNTYEVDLGEKNSAKIRKALEPFITAGRKVTKTPHGTRRHKAAPPGPLAAEVRAWAVQQGMEVPEKGRIPAEVREAFQAAHAA